MEPRDLSPPSELYIARDVIETAKELQTNLASMDEATQPHFAVEAIELLGDPREIYGSRKILIHALGAFVLTRDTERISIDESLYHGTYFGDAYMKSNFSRFGYVRTSLVKSLCLVLVETEILSSASNPTFEGEKIHSGVYVPMHSVEALFAA